MYLQGVYSTDGRKVERSTGWMESFKIVRTRKEYREAR